MNLHSITDIPTATMNIAVYEAMLNQVQLNTRDTVLDIPGQLREVWWDETRDEMMGRWSVRPDLPYLNAWADMEYYISVVEYSHASRPGREYIEEVNAGIARAEADPGQERYGWYVYQDHVIDIAEYRRP